VSRKLWAASVLIPCLCFGRTLPAKAHGSSATPPSSKHHKLPSSTAKPVTPRSSGAVATEQADLKHAEALSKPTRQPEPKKLVSTAPGSATPAGHHHTQSAQFGYRNPKPDVGVHLGQTKNTPQSAVGTKPSKH
jgi:hypothetical protein